MRDVKSSSFEVGNVELLLIRQALIKRKEINKSPKPTATLVWTSEEIPKAVESKVFVVITSWTSKFVEFCVFFEISLDICCNNLKKASSFCDWAVSASFLECTEYQLNAKARPEKIKLKPVDNWLKYSAKNSLLSFIECYYAIDKKRHFLL